MLVHVGVRCGGGFRWERGIPRCTQIHTSLIVNQAYVCATTNSTEVARLETKRKRKAVPNPNKRFMLMREAIAAGEPNAENPDLNNEPVKEEGEEEVNEGIDEDEDDEIEAPIRYTRSGRSIKRPDRLMQ
jgi:hypothetical protein